MSEEIVEDKLFFELTVASITPVTKEAVCVAFSIPEHLVERFSYKPGQYLTLNINLGGQDVRRSYSICSGVNDDTLEVAIKRVPGGLFSNFANDLLKVGDTVEVMPPQGRFCVRLQPERGKQYLFIAAGSGITPVISNLKSILESEPRSAVTLIYGNQRTPTIMFKERLSFLKNAYLDRLHWVNILSREDQGCELLNGRLNNAKGLALAQRLINVPTFDEYFICGPSGMPSEMSRWLRSHGVDAKSIHYELFAASAEDAENKLAKQRVRTENLAGRFSDVTIMHDGRSHEFTMAADGENLLDSGIGQGLDLPHSCKSGVCSTCRCRLLEGQVEMDIMHGLEPEEIEAGFVLACPAHPISDLVVLDFDQK